jgi:hypothetical protein
MGSGLDARERNYLKENFGDWIGSQLIKRETLRSKHATGDTHGSESGDQEILSTEDLWQAIKESLKPEE